MGCGSMKRMSAKESENFLEGIQVSDGSLNLMDISEDLSLLFLADEAGIGYLYSTFSTPIELLGKLVGHKGPISCSAIGDVVIYTGSGDNTIRKWSIETMDCLLIFEGHNNRINRVLCHGDLLFSTSYDKTAKVWFSNTSQEVLEAIYTSSNYDPCLRTLKGHSKSVYPIVFIPFEINLLTNYMINERDLVVTGSVDCTIRIWSPKYSECLKVLTGHSGPIYSIILDPMNNKQIITASGDGLILCWDVITGEILRTLKEHQGAVIAMHAHKRILFTGSVDKTARAWALEFGQCTRIFENNFSAVCQIYYYRGMVYAGLCDGTINIFDSKSGTLKKSLRGDFDVLTGLKNAGQRVFACGSNGKVYVWDISQIQEDTIFGARIIEEEESEEDCEIVTTAVQVIDKYFRH